MIGIMLAAIFGFVVGAVLGVWGAIRFFTNGGQMMMDYEE